MPCLYDITVRLHVVVTHSKKKVHIVLCQTEQLRETSTSHVPPTVLRRCDLCSGNLAATAS
eukprot:315960-Amphidinium_carterae.1